MAMTLITTNTSSGAATSDFTSSIDSTYKLYIFKFIDINPATNETDFSVQFNASSQSGYNETMTTAVFTAAHDEANTSTSLAYDASIDQANDDDAFQQLAPNVGNGADESCSGTLWLFSPSNTTYVTHFYARVNEYHQANYSQDNFVSGFINVTAAIINVQFKMSSGNFDGTIKMYGVG